MTGADGAGGIIQNSKEGSEQLGLYYTSLKRGGKLDQLDFERARRHFRVRTVNPTWNNVD